MRIVFIAPSAYLLGGVQDWLLMICQGLRALGHHVTVGVPNGYFHSQSRYNKKYAGLHAKSFKNYTGTIEGRRTALMDFLMKNPADIVVGVNIGDLYEAFSRISDKLNETRIVMTLHAIEANYFLDIKDYANILDAVITTNRLSQKLVQRLEVMNSERIYYAPYGITKDNNRTRATRKNLLHIAWVGRLENHQKRIDDVVALAKKLEMEKIDYKISIAGSGPEIERVKADLDWWVTEGKVIFKGVLNKDELSSFYRENDVLLITSEWETGPIVAWEALANGVAIVCSDYVGLTSENALVDGKTALLFPVGDIEMAAKKLLLLRNLNFRNQLVSKGREMVLERYTDEISIRAWEKAFTTILSMEKTKKTNSSVKKTKEASGRLDAILGVGLSERLRLILPKKRAIDAGSEWPHSLQAISSQYEILNIAKALDKDAQTT